MKDKLINAKLKIGNILIPIEKTFLISVEKGIVTISYPDLEDSEISKEIQLKTHILNVDVIVENNV